MKYLLLILTILPFHLFAQLEGNWHHKDPFKDNLLGISTERAYRHLANKTPDTVVVAIIDNGAMIKHKDLKSVIWVNKDEIPDNGIDDDNNGYIDDVHGWNFLGNPEGENLKMATTGLTRKYAFLQSKYGSLSEDEIDEKDKAEYELYLKVKIEFEQERKKIEDKIEANKDKVSMKKSVANWEKELATRLNPEYDKRQQLVGDNPDDINDSIYGNNQVWARGPFHGTGVAGVVGALNNGIGYSGVARHVKLMILRIVPNGDERDKDVALAIRYAVNNGAKVINCSFAKKYSMHPEFVAEAIAYAEQKSVLIVTGAGNSAINCDDIPYYPINMKPDGTAANNFISVGASAFRDGVGAIAYFSNYGYESVDVFAPGVQIGNCELNHKFGLGSGTSIAAPVVAGMAAVILSYYPHLSAAQVKEIIMKSVYIPSAKKVGQPDFNWNPNKAPNKKIKMKNTCKSGGIVNLYKAIILIENEYLEL
jgi:subtilisin family serine protease